MPPAVVPQSVIPPTVSQAVAEDITWGLDPTPNLAVGQTAAIISTTLTNISDGGSVVVALPDPPTMSGNVVLQRVRANHLQLGQTYLLVALVSLSSSTNVFQMNMEIYCSA